MKVARVLTTGRLASLIDVSARSIAKWIDSGLLVGYRTPASRERRVRIEEALAFARRHGLPSDRLEALGLRCGLAAITQATVLIYSPDMRIVSAFAEVSFEALSVADPFYLGITLIRRRYDLVLLDQLLGTIEILQRLAWLSAEAPASRRVVLAGEDDGHRRDWVLAQDYYQRPCDFVAMARELLGRLRAGSCQSAA